MFTAYSLAYVACILAGTPENLKFTHCFPEVLQTGHAMRKEECEELMVKLQTEPHIIDGHNPRRGQIRLAILVQAKCAPLSEA